MTDMRADETFMAHCLLYEFDQGSSASQAYQKLYKLYGHLTTKESNCERYFKQFKSGNFSFQDIFFSDSEGEDEEDQYVIPAKKLRVSGESVTKALKIPLDVLVDILKFLPRKSLSILEETNSLLYDTCRKHVTTLHLIKASLRLHTPFEADLVYLQTWERKEITDLIQFNAPKFHKSTWSDDSHSDVYIKNCELIAQNKCGYNAKTILKLLEGNLEELYINKVDDFNGCEIDTLIEQCKKNFESADQPKKYIVIIRAEDCPEYCMSYEPPAAFIVSTMSLMKS
uniref:Mos1 transposase HTH domain-containing protein n=1 Tax=Ditylenchus dipsaci TaxID=166011 RepID=A0A915DQH1_9BILA